MYDDKAKAETFAFTLAIKDNIPTFENRRARFKRQ
jgi:hypothetical protein